jgi:hypothetical protein
MVYIKAPWMFIRVQDQIYGSNISASNDRFSCRKLKTLLFAILHAANTLLETALRERRLQRTSAPNYTISNASEQIALTESWTKSQWGTGVIFHVE